MDPLTGKYKNMLLEVANFIEDGDLQRMKFRCDQIIKKAESQKISDPTEFFTALQQREHLGPANLEFLKDLLKTCCRGRVDGLRVVEQYERDHGFFGQPPPINHQQQQQHGFPHVQETQQPHVIYVVNDGANQNIPQRGNNGYTRYDGPDLSKEIDYLSRTIGKDWRFYVRSLGISEVDVENICEEHRSVRERTVQCLNIWKQQEQQACSKYRLIDALRHPSVQRNDIATVLEEGGCYT